MRRILVSLVVSAVLAVTAVTIAVWSRLGAPDFSTIAVVVAFTAGVLIAVQQAINGLGISWIRPRTGLPTAGLPGALPERRAQRLRKLCRCQAMKVLG